MTGHVPQHSGGRYAPMHAARVRWFRRMADWFKGRRHWLQGGEPYEDDDEFVASIEPLLPPRDRLDKLVENFLLAAPPWVPASQPELWGPWLVARRRAWALVGVA